MITIENINGEMFTVVWHNPREHISRHFSQIDLDCYCSLLFNGERIYTSATDGSHIATALPALPRNPTPKDAALIYRYMAEGIDLRFEITDVEFEYENGLSFADTVNHMDCCPIEITHATYNGQRVEIAIKENDDANT